MIDGLTIIDLSLPLSEELPCTWPGDVIFRHQLAHWYTDPGGAFATRSLTMSEHVGTHFDAPAHWVPPPDSGLPDAGPFGTQSAEQIALDQLVGRAAVLDARSAGKRIGVDVVESFEAEQGHLGEGDVVLLWTGWDRHYRRGEEGRRYIDTGEWPAPGAETIEVLVERKIRCIGIDTPSMGAPEDGYPAHIAGLARGVVYVEGLTRLERVPARGATFMFLPLKILGGTGAPGRAIALIDSSSDDHEGGPVPA